MGLKRFLADSENPTRKVRWKDKVSEKGFHNRDGGNGSADPVDRPSCGVLMRVDTQKLNRLRSIFKRLLLRIGG